ANTWTTPLTLSAEYNGAALDISAIAFTPVGSGASISYQPLPGGMLDPGKIAIVFLSSQGGADIYLACPPGTSAGIAMDPSIDLTGMGHAFHISTDRPIVAYDIYPYGGSASMVSSATLLLPTPSWGTNYIAADGFQADSSIGYEDDYPFIQIVA